MVGKKLQEIHDDDLISSVVLYEEEHVRKNTCQLGGNDRGRLRQENCFPAL